MATFWKQTKKFAAGFVAEQVKIALSFGCRDEYNFPGANMDDKEVLEI